MKQVTVTETVFLLEELSDTAPAWHYYRSQLAGTPCAQCQTCGTIYVYWETEDLEYHTEQHETETAQ